MKASTLPHDREAEVATLGAMIRDDERIPEVAEILQASHFYVKKHETIFDGIIGALEEKESVDLVILVDYLRQAGQLDHIGGPAYLAFLVEGAPSPANAVNYAEIVRQKAITRKLISTSQTIIDNCQSSALDWANLAKLHDQQGEAMEASDNRKFDLLWENPMEFVENLQKEDAMERYDLGFQPLDDLTGGMKAGEVMFIGAYAQTGKTTFALDIANHIARKHTVAFESFEMGRGSLKRKLYTMLTGVPQQKMRKQQLGDRDWSDLIKGSKEVSQLRLIIDDATFNLAELKLRIHRLVQQYDARVVMIDYLQLIDNPMPNRSREQEVASIAQAIKTIARKEDCAIITLCQLNRAAVEHEGGPQLFHLRESGAQEQAADFVVLMWRDVGKDTTTQFRLAKNRLDCRLGRFDLEFNRKKMSYMDTGPKEEDLPF